MENGGKSSQLLDTDIPPLFGATSPPESASISNRVFRFAGGGAPCGLTRAISASGGSPGGTAMAGCCKFVSSFIPRYAFIPTILLPSRKRKKGCPRLNELIDQSPFVVHVAKTFPLDEASYAHQAINEHYLGKMALRTT
jgi:hypothetical protein